ncbi:MAG TPA: hypothetical protein VNT81_13335 [Vicinamibacterales bacterium]|nr:hypothetical protein [Vicinamibacterales bacterium]
MTKLKQLWIKITQLAEVLEGMDDPRDEYVLSLGTRVDRLERDVERLAGQLQLHPAGGPRPGSDIAQPATS